MKFHDRREAGVALGLAIKELDPVDPVIYALPRGGVPVGYEVARELGCPLDILIVRKLGVPYQPELAMGAIAEGDLIIRNEDVLSLISLTPAEWDAVVDRERVELQSRIERYRRGAPAIPAAGHTAIVVDDGLATGSTALAAVSALGHMRAREVWLAVPVAPRSEMPELESRTDRMVVLSRPGGFGAVGRWYRDFTQTGDQEVRTLLDRSRLA